MKKLLLILSVAASTVLTISACNHSTGDPAPAATTPTTPTTPPINAATPGAGWRVSLFSEPGEDKTGDYSGYVFEFAPGGNATATGKGQTTTGTWLQSSSNGIPRFSIDFGSKEKVLTKLNHNWAIVSKTEVLISLTDDDASSAEHLQFSK